MSGARSPAVRFSPRLRAAIACATAVVLLPGCVREQVSPDATEFHYKWWACVAGLLPLVYAGLLVGKHPSTWINGAWRPWWMFREWDHLDLIRAAGAVALLLIGPFQLANRVVVTADAFEESNVLGLRSTRRVAWADVARLDVKMDPPGGRMLPGDKKQHDKKPSLVGVLRAGGTQEFQGWLINQAQPEIIRRARAAGVPVLETPNPGAMPAAAAPMAPAGPGGFQAFPPGGAPHFPRGPQRP